MRVPKRAPEQMELRRQLGEQRRKADREDAGLWAMQPEVIDRREGEAERLAEERGMRDRPLTPEEAAELEAERAEADREDSFLLDWQMGAMAQKADQTEEEEGQQDNE